MTRCIFHVEPQAVPERFGSDEVHVLLYGGNPIHKGTAAVGGQFRDLYKRLGAQPSTRAVDLVSIALAVTAADTFVLRSRASTAWERSIELDIPLCSPDAWRPIVPLLEEILAFLSGDRWTLLLRKNGEPVPTARVISRTQRKLKLSGTDSIALFSGGLDSTISAIAMLARERKPILVSHAYAGDAGVQRLIADNLPRRVPEISVNAWPTSSLTSEVSMRTRSFLFIAIGVLVCDAWATHNRKGAPALVVPENGFIAVNAPLTPRRVGSASTRTAHPHFLAQLRIALESMELPSDVSNPYEFCTKGEMVESVKDNDDFLSLAALTVSCAKWKRANAQCGRCFPCLIRRAALHSGGVDDKTPYVANELPRVIRGDEKKRDDLIALMSAVRRLDTGNLERWIARSGPLPFDQAYREALVDVVRRGFVEAKTYLDKVGVWR